MIELSTLPDRQPRRQLPYNERVARGWHKPVRERHYPTPPVVAQIIKQVAYDHAVRPALLTSEARWREIAHARFDAMSRLRAVSKPDGTPRFSLPHIGWLLGGRDHSTVKNGLRRWAKIQATREAAE